MNSEKYTLGYGKGSVALMASRSAASHAGFFLAHLRPGMQLLDVGCGPGTVTLGFAEAVHPGRVHGVELDLEQVGQVDAEARKRGLNLVFERADIYQLPYADESFDAVFLSAVVGNLQHPLDGFAEVMRVLKPGGLIGVKEFDHGGNISFPEPDYLLEVNRLYNRLRRSNGHDPDSGRKVKSYLIQTGFGEIECRATYQDTTPPAGMQGSLVMESIVREEWGPEFVARGWVTDADVESWIEASAARVTREDDLSVIAWVEALARKPF